MSNNVPTAVETFLRITPLNNGQPTGSDGNPLYPRKFVDFQGQAVDDPNFQAGGMTVGRTLVSSGWIPGGKLLWSVVDIVDSLVTSGLQTHPITNNGSPGGDNFGTAFFTPYAGRQCSGVRFRWGSGSPAVSVQCSLWDNAQASDGLRTTFAAAVTISAHAAGIYVATFASPVAILPGIWYVVSARETTGQYDCRLPASDPNGVYAAHFVAPWHPTSIAPGVLLTSSIPGTSETFPCSLIGGGGGTPNNWEPNQPFGTIVPIEPILI